MQSQEGIASTLGGQEKEDEENGKSMDVDKLSWGGKQKLSPPREYYISIIKYWLFCPNIK